MKAKDHPQTEGRASHTAARHMQRPCTETRMATSRSRGTGCGAGRAPVLGGDQRRLRQALL